MKSFIFHFLPIETELSYSDKLSFRKTFSGHVCSDAFISIVKALQETKKCLVEADNSEKLT